MKAACQQGSPGVIASVVAFSKHSFVSAWSFGVLFCRVFVFFIVYVVAGRSAFFFLLLVFYIMIAQRPMSLVSSNGIGLRIGLTHI